MGGACRLPPEWNGCKDKTDYCSTDALQRDGKAVSAVGRTFFGHRFDDIVELTDAKLIEPKTEGVLNHMQYRRVHIQASNESAQVNGEYSASFFPIVYEELEMRGLVMPMELPERELKPFPRYEDSWVDFLELRIKVEDAAEKCLPWKEDHVDSLRVMTDAPKIRFEDFVPSNLTNNNNSAVAHRHNRTQDGSVILPAFASDGTEMFLASMIEREADSWNLYLTTFLLCRDILQDDLYGLKATRIRPEKETIISWSKVVVAAYNAAHPQNGRLPATPKYFCKIKASSGGDSYTVEGEIIKIFERLLGLID